MKISRYEPTSYILDLSETAATKLKMSRNTANLKEFWQSQIFGLIFLVAE